MRFKNIKEGEVVQAAFGKSTPSRLPTNTEVHSFEKKRDSERAQFTYDVVHIPTGQFMGAHKDKAEAMRKAAGHGEGHAVMKWDHTIGDIVGGWHHHGAALTDGDIAHFQNSY